MTTAFRIALALAHALALAPALPASAAPGFANPLVQQRADPHVALHADGYYYYTATVPEYDRIELRRTRNLHELGKAEAKVVWRKHASGPMSSHIWAPELHHIDGKWYLYFTAGRTDAPFDIRLYVLENAAANPLDGQWIERGQLKTGWESFALDATTFTVGGRRYLAWTQRPPTATRHMTAVYIARMDTPLSIAGPATLLTTPDHAWEKRGQHVNEAPAALVKHGRVFLTYSASATDANYCLGMLSAAASADLTDPAAWTKSRCRCSRAMPPPGSMGRGTIHSPRPRTARPISWSTMRARIATSRVTRCMIRTATRGHRRSRGGRMGRRISGSLLRTRAGDW